VWRVEAIRTRRYAVAIKHMTARARRRILRAVVAMLFLAAEEASTMRLNGMCEKEAAREVERRREEEAEMRRTWDLEAQRMWRELEEEKERGLRAIEEIRHTWDQEVQRLCRELEEEKDMHTRELEEEKERGARAVEDAREDERVAVAAKMQSLQVGVLSALSMRHTHTRRARAFVKWVEVQDVFSRRRRLLRLAMLHARRRRAGAVLFVWHLICVARQCRCSRALHRGNGLMESHARRRRQKMCEAFGMWRSGVVLQMQMDGERMRAEFEHLHLRETAAVSALEQKVTKISQALNAANDKAAATSKEAARVVKERECALEREMRKEEEETAREAAVQRKLQAAVLCFGGKVRRKCLGHPLRAWNCFAIFWRRVRAGVQQVLVRSSLGSIRKMLSVWQQFVLRTRRRCRLFTRGAAKRRRSLLNLYCGCWREVALCEKRGREQEERRALAGRGEWAERELLTLMEAHERQRVLLEQEAVARRAWEEEEKEERRAREFEVAMLQEALDKERKETERERSRAQALGREKDANSRAHEREISDRVRERAEQDEQLSRLQHQLTVEQGARRARDEAEVRRRQEAEAVWEAERARERAERERERAERVQELEEEVRRRHETAAVWEAERARERAERESERAERERELAGVRSEMERELKAIEGKEAERERERARERAREREKEREVEAERERCPVAVAVKMEMDYDATLCDAASVGKFESEVRSEVAALLGIPVESIAVMSCERGSIVATLALLPQSRDSRSPANLAAQFVAHAEATKNSQKSVS